MSPSRCGEAKIAWGCGSSWAWSPRWAHLRDPEMAEDVQHGIDASICCAFAISDDASEAAIFLPDCAFVSETKLARSLQAAAVLPALNAACASSSFASWLVCVPFGRPSGCTS